MRNQTAFSFDGCLGHLPSKVHIMLAPDTKPISMAPYYASPMKHEVINKQLDLWLSQGIIEESKSPWGAPIIIVYCNGKPRVCIDWWKLNKVMVADQHPIPSRRTSCKPYLECNTSPYSMPSLVSHRWNSTKSPDP